MTFIVSRLKFLYQLNIILMNMQIYLQIYYYYVESLDSAVWCKIVGIFTSTEIFFVFLERYG